MLGSASETSLKCPGLWVLSQWLSYVGVEAPGRGLYWRSKVREEGGRLGNGFAYLEALALLVLIQP